MERNRTKITAIELTDDEFSRLQSALDSLEMHGHRSYDEAEGRGFLDRK